ncbi:hypothetical protein ACOMHN_042110 [Nucella lapillus]
MSSLADGNYLGFGRAQALMALAWDALIFVSRKQEKGNRERVKKLQEDHARSKRTVEWNSGVIFSSVSEQTDDQTPAPASCLAASPGQVKAAEGSRDAFLAEGNYFCLWQG